MKREWLACVGLVLLTSGPLLAQDTAKVDGQKPEEPAKEGAKAPAFKWVTTTQSYNVYASTAMSLFEWHHIRSPLPSMSTSRRPTWSAAPT